MNDIQIIYGDTKYIESFHKALSYVANERIYIEMIESPPIDKVKEFQESIISSGGPVSYALKGDEVIGWCDVFPKGNPRQSHRGC